MGRSVDLNADMGESFGAWVMGQDAALMPHISSANIACGFHAGDPSVMAQTIQLAQRHGVAIGAHPGFADLQGFGRRQIALSRDELTHMVQYQLGALQALAQAAGTRVRHLKLHGALANMASADADLARICYQAALAVDPKLTIMVMAATAMERVVEDLGCAYACEVFADRAYEDDATLVDRSLPGAVLDEPETIASRVVEMVQSDAIVARSGRRIAARIDTVCLHGDGPNAAELASAVRTSLEARGVTISGF